MSVKLTKWEIIFKKNKYTKLYFQLIQRANNREINGYYEKHHIIPVCIGGTNDNSNLVKLTAKEHYIAHLLLTKSVNNQYKGPICAAYILMRNRVKKRYKKSSCRLYQILQEQTSKYLSKKLSGKKCPWKGKKLPDEWRNKIRDNHKCWNRGKQNCYSDDTIEKMRRSAKQRVLQDPDHVKKAAQKRAENWKGKKHSKESIEKMRKAAIGKLGTTTGRKWYNNGVIERLFKPGTQPKEFKLGRIRK